MKIKCARKFKLIEVWSGEIVEQIQIQSFLNVWGTLDEDQIYTNGELSSTILFTYDEQGNLLTERQTDGSGRLVSEVVYQYQNGRMQEKKEYFSHGPGSTLKFYYDGQNNLIKEVETNADDQVTFQLLYNLKENSSTNQEFDLDGQLIHEKILYHNIHDNLIKEVDRYFSKEENSEDITLYSYDENQFLINVKIYEDAELVVNEDYFNDANGYQIGSEGIEYETSEKITIKRIINAEGQVLKEEQFLNDLLQFEKHFSFNEQQYIEEEHFISYELGTDQVTEEKFKYTYEYGL